MQFLKNWLQSRATKARAFEPATGDQLRKNVRKLHARWVVDKKKLLVERLHAQPPDHPGDLFYILEQLSKYALELAMLDWREGIDPRPHLNEIQSGFALALDIRPDILPGNQNPGFMAIIADLMGWKLPFDTAPPGADLLKFDIIWMDRWIIAGLTDPSYWPLKAKAPATKIQFIDQSLKDYWALLTDQVDADEGMRRCIKNYNRRATHPTYKSLSSYLGGGAYNELYVDYTLAAILKKRGLVSGSVHDWVWG